MRNVYAVRAVVAGIGLYAAVALAADPGINLNAKLAKEKVAVRVATGNPTVVVVRAHGPVLNANIHLQGQSSDCLVLVNEIAGVCVPIGPGVPVSPN